MYKKILVKELITAGAQLLESLSRNRFPVVAALWNYFPDAMEWRLVIVSPIVDHLGPLAAYTRVQHVLGAAPSPLTVSDIALIGPDTEDYKNLRESLSSPGRFSDRSTESYTQNVIFEDSYIYPIAAPRR